MSKIHSQPNTSSVFPRVLASIFFMLLLGVSYFLRAFGLVGLSALGAVLGRVLYSLHFRRKIVRDNLLLAFKEEKNTFEIALLERRVFSEIGKTFLGIARNFSLGQATMRKELHLSEANRKKISTYLKPDQGAVFITGHIANWEHFAMGMAAHGVPVSIVVKRMNNPISQIMIEKLRLRRGLEVIHAGGTIEKMRQALTQGRAIGFMIDQNTTGTKGIRANFFSTPASSIRGLAKLARDANCPIVPICAFRNRDGTQTVQVLDALPYLEAKEFAANSHEIEIREEWLNTQQYQAAVESLIRREPSQWLWIHRRWKANRTPLVAGQEHRENL